MQWTIPLNKFALKKNAYGSLVFFNQVPYMPLSFMITGVNIISRKVSVVSANRAWEVWGCSETPARPLRKFSGAKEHLNWLKIDLNASKIIFKTINTHKINVNGSTHIKC